MNFVVLGRDPPGGAPRRRHRADHLDHVANHQDKIVYAGPLLDEAGAMTGSIFVFDGPDRASLDAYLAGDPYFDPGIFASVEIWQSRWMVPERQPGFLKAEAERARR
jgi:uncharacterized protein YciI